MPKRKIDNQRAIGSCSWLVAQGKLARGRWVLAVKILLFVFVVKSYRVLENQSLQGGHDWLEIWNRWDALPDRGSLLFPAFLPVFGRGLVAF